MRRQQGQAIVEMAIVITLLVLLMVGMVYFAAFFFRAYGIFQSVVVASDELSIKGASSSTMATCDNPAGDIIGIACQNISEFVPSEDLSRITIKIVDENNNLKGKFQYNEIAGVRAEYNVSLRILWYDYSFTVPIIVYQRVRREVP